MLEDLIDSFIILPTQNNGEWHFTWRDVHWLKKTLPVHPSARALESCMVLTILDAQSNTEKISFSLALKCYTVFIVVSHMGFILGLNQGWAKTFPALEQI